MDAGADYTSILIYKIQHSAVVYRLELVPHQWYGEALHHDDVSRQSPAYGTYYT